MRLFPDQGILAGTAPASERGRTVFCTYRVTDSGGFLPPQSVSWLLRLAVGSPAPSLTLPSPDRVALSVGRYHGEALPPATGGVAPYTYSFACAGGALPSGMGFAAATRMFAGTPQARFRDSCTYTVTDSAQPAATVSVPVEVEVSGAAPLMLPSVPDQAFNIGVHRSVVFPPAMGGVGPYTYELECELPEGLGFSPDTRVLSGSPLEAYRGRDCTYRATDSATPPARVARSVALVVDPLDRGTWRFRTRTKDPAGPCTIPNPGDRTRVAILPHAQGGAAGEDDYAMIDFPNAHFLEFDRMTRRLTYVHPSAPPILGTPNTYRYLVGSRNRRGNVDAANADDVLCLDVQFDPGDDACDSNRYIHITLRVRDDAYWDEARDEYRCPDTTASTPRSAAQTVSNPVHEALGPVHARRAADAAHGAVRDAVRRWRPGAPRPLTAVSPVIGLASLSGSSGGFAYDGSSESVSAGAELGAGAWQAGAVASYTRTELHYRAGADLAGRGYLAGEHDTEILSLHPFAAWHMPSGGHLWASLGAGMGELSHRDDMGFPSWSRSDVRLRAHAAGAALPIADILSGELEAEAGIEAFAFEIEGGDRISSTLPTLRGRDYRAGLAWSAPIAGAPSLSVAYKHLTGDGPEGGQLEAKGSLSIEGILDPRLTVIGNAEGSFGLGGHDHDSWGLRGGVRFAPGEGKRGFGLDLDTRLVSPEGNGGSPDVGIRGEAGYGLWSGPYLGTVRPYVGLIRYSSDGSLRRALGLDLRDMPDSRANVEIHDLPHDGTLALGFSLQHRF